MTTRTPAEVQEMWASELESGNWDQCQNRLKAGKGQEAKYCCLGVLTRLAVREGVVSRFIGREGMSTLSEPVMKWAGIVSRSGFYQPSATARTDNPYAGNLARMNDSGTPFAEIAKVIRKRPKGLFVATSEEGQS